VTVVRRGGVIVCVILLAVSAAAADTSVTIAFERFPGQDGTLETPDDTFPTCSGGPLAVCDPLGSQFASLGVLFSSGLILQGTLFPGSSETNHFVSSSPIDATFAIPVTGIAITSYSVWNATLYALDEANNVIASDTLTNPTGGFFLGRLSVSTTTPIHRFTVLAGDCVIGERCDQILNLDDLVVTFGSGATSVAVDIRPGSDSNVVNPRSRGRIEVAILSAESFDATTVDPATVRFGINGATAVRWEFDDVDRDGDLDLILQFRTQDTGIACGETTASVTGQTFTGQQIMGSDSVRTVGCP
jgi:hypothetical protein